MPDRLPRRKPAVPDVVIYGPPDTPIVPAPEKTTPSDDTSIGERIRRAIFDNPNPPTGADAVNSAFPSTPNPLVPQSPPLTPPGTGPNAVNPDRFGYPTDPDPNGPSAYHWTIYGPSESSDTPAPDKKDGPAPGPDYTPTTPEDKPAVAQDPSFEDYLKMMEQIYGPTQYSNPAQDRADAEAERQNKRTGLLAQLALAGGMAQGAGGAWEGVGQGFLNAASVYDKGFARYQAALQSSADRYGRDAIRQQTVDVAKKKAAFDLWTNQATLRREETKDRRSEINKMFESEISAIKDNMMNDPTQLREIMDRWRHSLAVGEYIAPGNAKVDVADK